MLLLVTGIAHLAAANYILGLGFFLAQPGFVCKDGKECSSDRACSEGQYHFSTDSVHSMVYEWELVCAQQYQVSLIGSAYFLGVTVGSLLISVFTDKWGRQRTCIFSILLLGCSLLSASFSPWVILIDILTVLAGFSETILTAALFLLLNESLPSDKRVWYTGMSIAFWSVGTMFDAALFYFLPNWRYVMFVCAVIPFIGGLGLMYANESVRWLVANKKDFNTALAVLRKTAKGNGLDPMTIHLQPLVNSQENDNDKDSINSGFRGLLSSSELRRRAFYATFLWATSTLSYYGLLICVSTYSGNIYENGVALSIGELSVTLIVGRFMNNWNRRPAFLISQVVAAVAATGAWIAGFKPTVSCRVLSIAGLVLGMGATDALFLMVYIYTAEIFPTKVRAAGYALTSSAARVGGLLAGNLMLLQSYTGISPLLMIAGAMLVTTIPCICLPETMGQTLLDYR